MKATAYYFSSELTTSLVNYGRTSKGSNKLMICDVQPGVIRDNPTLVILDGSLLGGTSRDTWQVKGGLNFKCVHTLRGDGKTLACDNGVLIPKGATFERSRHLVSLSFVESDLAVFDRRTNTLCSWSIPKKAKASRVGLHEQEELYLFMRMIFERSLHVLRNKTSESHLVAKAMLLTVEYIVLRAHSSALSLPNKYSRLVTNDVLNLFSSSSMDQVCKKLYDLLKLGKRTTEEVNFPEEYFKGSTRYRGYPFSARIQRTSSDGSLLSVFVGPTGSNYVASQFEFTQLPEGKTQVQVERII